MYQATSRFILAGLSPDWTDAIQKTAPLDHFTHSFEVVDGPLDKIPADTTAVIFSDESGLDPSTLRQRMAAGGRLVLCTDKPASFDGEAFAALDDIWPLSATGQLASFFFRRLISRIKADEDVWFANLCLDTVLGTEQDLIWFKDTEGVYHNVNEAFCRHAGKTKEEIHGKRHGYVWSSQSEEDENAASVDFQVAEEAMLRGVASVEEENVSSPKGVLTIQTFKTPLRDRKGTIIGTVGIGRDVTQLRRYEAELLHAANSDELTGLANRRYFSEYINKNRGHQPLTVARIDLAYFKQVNDTYGPKKGDEALVKMAGFLREIFKGAVLCRFGGGQFLMAVLGGWPIEAIKDKFQKLLKKLQEYCASDENPIMLSANMGITETKDPATSLDKLIRQSDLALYFTRNLGEGQCCVFSEIIGE